jgi:hypothetical protein
MPTRGQTIPNMGPVQGRSISAYESSDHKVLLPVGTVWLYKEWAMKQGTVIQEWAVIQGESIPGFKGATTTPINTSQPKGYSLKMAQLIGPRCDHAK